MGGSVRANRDLEQGRGDSEARDDDKDVRFVHIGSSNCTRFISLIHKSHHFVVTCYDELG